MYTTYHEEIRKVKDKMLHPVYKLTQDLYVSHNFGHIFFVDLILLTPGRDIQHSILIIRHIGIDYVSAPIRAPLYILSILVSLLVVQ